MFLKEIWDVHHFHSFEVHKKPNMIAVQFGKYSLTCKILHNDPHHRGILVVKEPKGKGPLLFILVPGIDVWIIVVLIQILCFIPFLPHIRNPCIIKNDGG